MKQVKDMPTLHSLSLSLFIDMASKENGEFSIVTMSTRWRIESEPFVVYLWLETMMKNAIPICGLYNKSPTHVGHVNSLRKVFSLRSYKHDQGTTF